ncbi:PIKK family atypical protein kinase [Tritrichomonas foetus]|uniref:Serine/threonine-protein kinase TOR n=1 Tax=Tritrichomonas foetus TaxID=1144522 RepID=A0A1J4JJE5_9EUKA|nr:PIKK family atypical protein kinase [Tritrichomonas foetus]|eukprot:OHS97693.1 PIKK family atypical protein kinase [Tritrichomonas foetus]
MNLSTLEIPQFSDEMIKKYRDYYCAFYLEMVRMSNANLNTYISNFIQLITKLAKSGLKPDIIRSAIGVVALHEFGYDNFNELSSIFDRLLPQTDLEYVKFTSWCAGQLTHHPTVEQSRYASLLFRRLIGWTRSTGRRSRNLAAAYLLDSLSNACGMVVVVFFPALQSIIWRLVSDESMTVLNATASAVDNFTCAVIRYTRSDLTTYLDFFSKLCPNLLSFGEPIRRYIALLLLKKLINNSPDYYVPKFLTLYDSIMESTIDQPLYVKSMCYGVMASLAQVDPKQFVQIVAKEFFSKTPELLEKFPQETVESLCILIRAIPFHMKTKLEQIKEFAENLINYPDSAFPLLTQIFKSFGILALPIDDEMVTSLMETPITEEYRSFIVTSCKMFSNSFSKKNKTILSNRLKTELSSNKPLLALQIIAEIPPECLINHNEILDALNPLKASLNIPTRQAVPKAIFNIAKHCQGISHEFIVDEMFHLALYDHALEVRAAALSVLHDNTDKSLASPECMKFFQVFVNDDATTVRRLTFRILEKLLVFNPIMVTSITRNALLDSFFIIRNVPSIRQRSRTAKCLPDLVRASAKTITVYSSGFMDIAVDVFAKRATQNQKFENFLEVHANDSFLIGIVDTVALLAPLDPEVVAKHGDFLLMFLCQCLNNENNRLLILSVLNLLYVLLIAPASSLLYRAKAPLILSSVSNLLATTDSRNERLACLQVIGAIGVLEVHQKPTPVSCVSPPNIEDSLARQFYHPSRDIETDIDDSLLLNPYPEADSQYNTCFVADAVLEIFKDESLDEFYFECVHALVNIFEKQKTYMLAYFDLFITRLLDVMKTSTDFEMKKYLPLYAQLINNSQNNISPFVKQSLELINDRFSHDLAQEFVSVILALLNALKDAYSPYASETICLLIGILDNSKTTDATLCRDVLNAFAVVGIYAADLLYLIVPQICDAVECEQTLPKVRVHALHALTTLTRSVDLFPYLGPIMRAMSFGLFYPDPKTSHSAFDFLCTILKAQGLQFMKSAEPIIQIIRSRNMSTKELDDVVTQVKKGDFNTTFKPLPKEIKAKFNQSNRNKASAYIFSEDAITTKAMTPNLGREQHLEQWLRSFTLTVVSNSPSAEIRACTTLATSYVPLATKLFNIAFLSCWTFLSENAKKQITQSFSDLLNASGTYDTVNHEIIKLLVFMDKIEKPLDIPISDLLSASIRYGGAAFALHLVSRDIEKNPDDIERIETIIDLYAKLSSWPNAIGVWKKSQMKSSHLNKVEVLARLKMWDQVEPAYHEHFYEHRDFRSFVGMTESLAALAMWDDLMGLFETFRSLKRHQKAQVAPYFAAAAMRLGKWDCLDKALEAAPEDSLSCTCMAALNALHKKQYNKVDEYVAHGFSLIASSPIAFLADNQQIHHEIMVTCQELVEISEMKSWTLNIHRKEIEEVWNERLKTAPRDFDLWFGIIANRAGFAEIKDQNIIKFFSMKSATLGTKLHSNAFESLFPAFDWNTAPDLHKVCYIVAHWNTGEKQRALSEMSQLTKTLTGSLLVECQLIYSNWILEVDDSLEGLKSAYIHLKSIIDHQGNEHDGIKNILNSPSGKRTMSNLAAKRMRRATSETINGLVLPVQIFKELTSNTTSVDLLRKWSDVNVALISLDNSHVTHYVTNAIDSLTRCAQLSPSFPDIVLLLNLFFEHADISTVFSTTAHSCIEALQPKLLLQASPQLLVQLSHPSKSVADFVHDIIINLLNEHYHELLFSVIVLTKSNNLGRSRAAHSILEEFHQSHHDVYDEVILIRKCMLRAAVTWPEMMLNQITDAFEHFKHGQYLKMRETLEVICEMGNKERAKCPMHIQFQKEYGDDIRQLRLILDSFIPTEQKSISEVSAWCKSTQDKLSEELKQIRTIQMAAISPELCERTHFLFAVFGTYKPYRPIIKIQYFVGQFSVYMSKQQPKDVIVKGEDGNFYQYLLKGHEDLRLDERIMQFFRLINSLLMKESCFNSNFIQTICVIPLSLGHGLVQWVPGTETLRNVVEDYRRLHGVEPMAEYELANRLSVMNFDQLIPIQKMQVIEYVFRDIPDTDIANSFWLKAPSAEAWLKRTNTFAISTAITSIVGYIIGLGDRHPSNLLIDRNTGKVIHIDFGDCFEKAMIRKFLPEVVPFRLTRMMAKAFGAAGVDGLFRSSFINMSNLLRENCRVLVMVLAVFVHEPLIDPEELEPNAELMQCAAASGIQVEKLIVPKEKLNTSSKEIRKRVRQKLTGTDFEEGTHLSVEDQATKLIQMATDTYNLSRMYSGWCPYW